MPQSNIKTWLDFAVQQMAAESYLNALPPNNDDELIRRLKLGNNNSQTLDPDLNPILPGKTRLTISQAQQFAQRYEIVDHHANDATGFSATLIYDAQTSSYTLSFRSTEFQTQANGGDRERDGFGADLEITSDGFAFGQLVAMENYYQQLKNSGLLPTGAALNVTGYSLGGHLATVFTELHTNEVNHTYTFNGAGRGHITGTGATEADRIQGMLTLFRTVLFNPDAGLSIIADQLNPRYLQAQGLVGQPFTPFTSETTLGGAGNIYTDARYRWAVEVATTAYDTAGVSGSPGEVGTSPAFAKITQLYGLATTGDLTVVANSGVHGPATPVFIEGQPLIEGVPLFQDQADFGNTHSITLLVDSLATQDLIQHIDPLYGQASAELLIKASSNSKADTVAPLNTLDVVEGESLEKTVDAFRKLFLGPTLPVPNPLPVDSRVGGFGNLANRNDMYAAMAAIQQAVQAKQAQGIVFTIDDLTNPTVSSPAIAGIADTDTDQGLAYRYALKELNPFAIVANTPQANDALYQVHNDQGQLIRVNPTDGTGALTTQYLDDRALFLKEKIALNQLDQDTSSRTIHFQDVASGYEIKIPLTLALARREFLFGSDDIDTLTGGSKDDHLYGGGSVDVLIGNAGWDYMEGGGGSDRLEGGAGADTMVGGSGNDTYLVDDPGDRVIEVGDNGNDSVESSVNFSLVETTVETLTLTGTDDLNGTGNDLDNLITGNAGINRLDGKGGTDHLIGGIGNDILLGGTGDSDLLEGGAGFDTYYYNAGDGNDTIEDSDANGRIIFDGRILLGGVRKADDPADTYKSLDDTFTYVMSGGHLIVNGVLTINADFQSGQFGIDLLDRSDDSTGALPTIDYNNGQQTITWVGGNSGNTPGFTTPANYILFGLGGSDLLDLHTSASLYYHQIHGGLGSDDLSGGAGKDRLYGDEELDWLQGYGGEDVLFGGDGDDWIIGDTHIAPDIPDVVPGNDYLDGESGNDTLEGQGGDDVLHGGFGNDWLCGDDNTGFVTRPIGNDYLDGGEGDVEENGVRNRFLLV